MIRPPLSYVLLLVLRQSSPDISKTFIYAIIALQFFFIIRCLIFTLLERIRYQ